MSEIIYCSLDVFNCVVYVELHFLFILILVNHYNCHFLCGIYSRSCSLQEPGGRIAVTKNGFRKMGVISMQSFVAVST